MFGPQRSFKMQTIKKTLEARRQFFFYYIHFCPPSPYDKFAQLENQSDVSHFEKKVAKGFLTS